MNMRRPSRLLALPLLFAAGALFCHATPIVVTGAPSVALEQETPASVVRLSETPPADAADGKETGAGPVTSDDLPTPLQLAAGDDAPPLPAGEHSDPSVWLYALGGCTAVAAAAFRAR